MKPTYEQLEQQLAAVVAENAGLKDAIGAVNGIAEECEVNGDEFKYVVEPSEFEALIDLLDETSATDAYLTEVRAQQHAETLNDLVRHIDKSIDIGSLKTPWELSSEIVDYVNQQLHSEFATQLRQGAEHE